MVSKTLMSIKLGLAPIYGGIVYEMIRLVKGGLQPLKKMEPHKEKKKKNGGAKKSHFKMEHYLKFPVYIFFSFE